MDAMCRSLAQDSDSGKPSLRQRQGRSQTAIARAVFDLPNANSTADSAITLFFCPKATEIRTCSGDLGLASAGQKRPLHALSETVLNLPGHGRLS